MMKCVYGSQNFGYDNEQSDTDYLEFVVPTWDDILNNRMTSVDHSNEDGSITKVKDIRYLVKMLEKGNVNDLQILFSNFEGCNPKEKEFLNKIISKREEYIKGNLEKFYFTNLGYINGQCSQAGVKGYIRALATYKILLDATHNEFTFTHKELKFIRIKLEEMTEEKLEKERLRLVQATEFLKPYFENKKKNEQLFEELRQEVKKFLKENVK